MCEHEDTWANVDTYCMRCVERDAATIKQLTTENEALHGLLANACVALVNIDAAASQPLTVSRIARDTLAQIREGAVT